jgi:hypothetical protein
MTYWYANEMDVSSEVFDFNNFIAQGYVQCFNEKCKMDGCLVHNRIRGKYMQQHMYPSDASLLYGRHSTSAKVCDVVDQMVHGDIAPCTIDGVKYCVSTNPKLAGKSTPTSIIFPVSFSGREIYFLGENCEKVNVKIQLGEVVVFRGDVAHGGKSYTRPRRSRELYPAIHAKMLSLHHSNDDDDDVVVTMPEQLAHICPQMLGRLQHCDQREALIPMTKKILEGLESCLSADDANEDLKTEMIDWHSQISKVLGIGQEKRKQSKKSDK